MDEKTKKKIVGCSALSGLVGISTIGVSIVSKLNNEIENNNNFDKERIIKNEK